MLSTALTGALVAHVSVGDAYAQRAPLLSPLSGWQVMPVYESQQGDFSYCSIARVYDTNLLLTFAVNAALETTVAYEFGAPIGVVDSEVDVTLDPGAGEQRVNSAKSVEGRAFVVRLGNDPSFWKAVEKTGLIRSEIAEKNFMLNISDMEQGRSMLIDCLQEGRLAQSQKEARERELALRMENSRHEIELSTAIHQETLNNEVATDMAYKQDSIGEAKDSTIISLRERVTVLRRENERLQKMLVTSNADTGSSVDVRAADMEMSYLRRENEALRAEMSRVKLARMVAPLAQEASLSRGVAEQVRILSGALASVKQERDALAKQLHEAGNAAVRPMSELEAENLVLSDKVKRLEDVILALRDRNTELVSEASAMTEKISALVINPNPAFEEMDLVFVDADVRERQPIDLVKAPRMDRRITTEASIPVSREEAEAEFAQVAKTLTGFQSDIISPLRLPVDDNAPAVPVVHQSHRAIFPRHDVEAPLLQSAAVEMVSNADEVLFEFDAQESIGAVVRDDPSVEIRIAQIDMQTMAMNQAQRMEQEMMNALSDEVYIDSVREARLEKEAQAAAEQKRLEAESVAAQAIAAPAALSDMDDTDVMRQLNDAVDQHMEAMRSSREQEESAKTEAARVEAQILQDLRREEEQAHMMAAQREQELREATGREEQTLSSVAASDDFIAVPEVTMESIAPAKSQEGTDRAAVQEPKPQVVAKATPTLFEPAFDIKELVEKQGVRVSEFRMLEGPSNRAKKVYQWRTGPMFGIAELSQFGDVAQFDAQVLQYLERAETRCDGEFAVTAVRSEGYEDRRVDAYDMACVTDTDSSSASLVFFNLHDTFAGVAFETTLGQFDDAMLSRDHIFEAMKEAG